MKKLFATTAAVLFALPASAEDVQDFYKTITKQIPQTQQVCEIVDVPIYGNVGNGASAGDVLGGMIIGGLIGKGVTNKDNGAAAGAVLGGMIAADKKNQQGVVGYRQEQRCTNHTTYSSVSEEVYSHSVVTFNHDGRTYRLKFTK